jgi:uncharacterized protein YkwD
MRMSRRSLAPLVPLAAALTLAVLAPWAGAAKSSQSVSVDVGIFQQLNTIRTEHGLTPLVLSTKLADAAEQHSQDMIEKGYFSHGSSNGESFGARLATFYPEGGAHYWAVGENIFWSPGVPTASKSMQAWMDSPPHRENILNPDWRQIGIGAVSSTDAPGTYGGHAVTVITADFGVRRR